jgi:hypothetical protein
MGGEEELGREERDNSRKGNVLPGKSGVILALACRYLHCV